MEDIMAMERIASLEHLPLLLIDEVNSENRWSFPSS
jgi:hypothetical protein